MWNFIFKQLIFLYTLSFAPKTLYAPIGYAIAHSMDDERACGQQRIELREAIVALAEAVQDEQQMILNLVDPFILPMVTKGNIPFLREVCFTINWQGPALLYDIAFGMPALGQALGHQHCCSGGPRPKVPSASSCSMWTNITL